MTRRTTIELDGALLAEAQEVLRTPTMRATVEEALRRSVASAREEQDALRARQLAYLGDLSEIVDLDVLARDDMWR